MTLKPEFEMTRSRRRLTGWVALLALAATAASADAATLRRRHHPHHPVVASREPSFPNYIDQGVDRQPGRDNEYFSDTKSPTFLHNEGSYLVGPGYFQRWW
jgi:hypothetical protein